MKDQGFIEFFRDHYLRVPGVKPGLGAIALGIGLELASATTGNDILMLGGFAVIAGGATKL
ncbi:MAG: hypothetical protein WDN66_02680 [Candidatus Saccharibacteria bacterium]